MITADTATPESVEAALNEAFSIAEKSLEVQKMASFGNYQTRKQAYYDKFVNDGLTVRQISDLFGVSYQAVRSGLHRMGITSRDRGTGQ
ncbi:hypothetical protein OU789_10900 [Halocynthiibacter sp. C4]|uniref:hypothetical protein n=1 Tax=Halocynthiibacter sp. C4 TaxID=2992758 RepID=UPI00237C4029|nr:hypothetical protein [Halocynthiibacter sp. C4]MDE0590435.1 hypothetical protein [Halocynthiibacter sp. C4]